MDLTALATAVTGTSGEPKNSFYGHIYYEDGDGKLLTVFKCQTKAEYDFELAAACHWVEAESGAVAVRGVPVGVLA